MTSKRDTIHRTGLYSITAALLLSVIGCAAPKEANSQATEIAPAQNARFDLVGDGQADDTAALQRMIDAGEGAVRLPKGVYRITKPLVVELDKTGVTALHGNGVATLRMEGAGPAVKIIGTHFGTAAPRTVEDRVWTRQRMPIVDGLAIAGAHPEADGIEAVGTMQMTLTRLHIRGCRDGIRLAKNNRNVLIADSHIYENHGTGIYLDNVNLHQINITGTHVSYNARGGIVSRRGNVRNLHIANCDLESNMAADEDPTANILIDSRNSAGGTGEVAITGSTIQHNSNAPGSANIRIIGASKPTQKLKRVREGHITITGNILSDVHVNVHLKECRGVVITGNTMWMGYEHNMLIEGCSSVVVGANNLDRNPRYTYGKSAEAHNSVVFRDSENCTINGLHLSGVHHAPAALTLERCRRIHLTNSTLLDCDNIALLLDEVTDSRITNLLIRDDRPNADSTRVVQRGGSGNHINPDLLKSP